MHSSWECKMVSYDTLENILHYIVKLKMLIPYKLALSLLGVYPRETLAHMFQESCTRMFLAARLQQQNTENILRVQGQENGEIHISENE